VLGGSIPVAVDRVQVEDLHSGKHSSYSCLSMAALARPAIERYQASLTDPDQATAETIAIMCRHIANSASDPLFQKYAREAVWRFGGGVSGGCPIAANKILRFNARDPRICAFADFWWSRHYIKFVHHEEMLMKWLNEADQLQLLISPDALIRMVRPQGDCAIFTMAICALLKCQGVEFEIVTVAVSRDRPNEYSHVFPRAVLPNGARLTLDAGRSGFVGMYPGWQVPMSHRFRTQVWDEDGRPIQDVPQWSGLHDYVRRGMGQDDTGLSPAAIAVLAPGPSPSDIIFSPPSLSSVVSPGPGTGPPSPSVTSFLEGLTSQGLNLVGKIVAPTTTIQRGPQGQVLIQTPASSGQATSLLTTAGTLGVTGNMGTLLLLGGGVLVLALLFKGRK